MILFILDSFFSTIVQTLDSEGTSVDVNKHDKMAHDKDVYINVNITIEKKEHGFPSAKPVNQKTPLDATHAGRRPPARTCPLLLHDAPLVAVFLFLERTCWCQTPVTYRPRDRTS